ncbi:putative cysteine-rich repeat secretory protein 10 [Bidens hawaiensis]|uniref:putative cysteine-rich repeat secretory protein 10 n=1 Tax=Bidens hawaiensis TaxID=980011 RepID=UPI00404A7B3C
METKFLVSLILLQAIFNNANLNIPPHLQYAICGKDGNFNSNDLLKDRDDALNMVDIRLGHRPDYNGFQSGGSRGVWTKAQCPPNIKKEVCQECVRKTIPVLKKNCPKQTEGAAWSVAKKMYCMVHYADNQTRINLSDWIEFSTATPVAPGTAAELEKGLNNLANKLKDIATRSNSRGNYGYASISYGPGSRTLLYGSMQCYDEIRRDECMTCLSEATKQLYDLCNIRSLAPPILSALATKSSRICFWLLKTR